MNGIFKHAVVVTWIVSTLIVATPPALAANVIRTSRHTVVAFSSYLGGDGLDEVVGVGVDASGCVYVVGQTESLNFPTTSGAFQEQLNGVQSDVFVSKFDPSGRQLIYSTYIGGSASEKAAGIVVDSVGNVTITGSTQSLDFPTSAGAFQVDPGGFVDGFVAMLNSTGTELRYSTYVGGLGVDEALGIAADASGRVYVTGLAASGFPTTPNAFQMLGDGSDAFVLAIRDSGVVDYSTYVGGNGVDEGHAVAVDDSGQAFLTGQTTSDDLPTSPTAAQPATGGGIDCFVVGLSADGASLSYCSYLGGAMADVGRAVAVDSFGSVYLAGQAAAGFPTLVGAAQSNAAGFLDAFVTKVDIATGRVTYSTYLGGSGDIEFGCPEFCVIEGALALVVDEEGNAYAAGQTVSKDFPTLNASGIQAKKPARGSSAGFVTKFGPAGSMLRSAFIGGRADETARGLARDPAGNVYLVGYTTSTNFPVTPGSFQDTALAGAGFVAKLAAPLITEADVKNRDVIVKGQYFDAGAVILLDGIQQLTKTRESATTPTLVGKRLADMIPVGLTVALRVRNSDGTLWGPRIKRKKLYAKG